MLIQNLLNLLLRAAEHPSGNGLTFHHSNSKRNPSSISYKALLELIEQRSMQLQEVESIDTKVVLIYFTDNLDSIIWFWTVVAAGGIPCICPPLAKDLDQRQNYVRYLLDLLERPLVITTWSLSLEFLAVEGLRVVTIDDIKSVLFGPSTGELTLRGRHKLEQDLAVLMLTSGSSGDPKAVCLQHGQIISSLTGKSIHHGTTKEDVFLNWIGVDHVANLTEIHLHAISLAAQQVHIQGTDVLANPMWFLETIHSYKVTYTFAPNFFLAAVVRSCESFNVAGSLSSESSKTPSSNLSEDLETLVSTPSGSNNSQPALDLSSLRALISGGESNVVDTCDKLTHLLGQYGASTYFIRPGFGMTETCAGCIYNATNCPSYDITAGAEFCSLGESIHGLQMRIVRSDGTVAEVKEVGSLEVTGSVVFRGYYNDEKATREAFTPDGWFKTGDLGLRDSGGRLRLTGRHKDTVVINGVSHSCHAIEAALERTSIPGVTPSFAIVFPHRPKHSATETLCVSYLPCYASEDLRSRRSTTSAISRAVVKCCGTRPFKIIPLPATLLQKSSLGKLPRSKIQRDFEQGAYYKYEHDERINQTFGDICELAVTATQKAILQVYHDVFNTNDAEIGIYSDLFEIGFSSIDLLKLQSHLGKVLKIEVPIAVFFSHPVIRDLSQALDELQKRKNYDPITVLQPNGTKIPLFFIHPGVGDVLIFLNLARYIDDRPVYALRARGFDGEEYFSSIEEMITVYHKAIKQVQPAGPYALAGYSFGSILAFEITKVMEANGDRVQFLAAFDQPPHFKKRARTYDWYEVVLSISFFMGLIKEDYAYSVLPEMRKRTHEQVLDHILEFAASSRLYEVGLSRERLGNWAQLAYQLKVIGWDYDPTGVVANMDIFYARHLVGRVKAKTMQEWFDDYISKWTEFSKDVKFHIVDGTHRTMISPPNAVGCQKLLKAAMEERGL